MIYENFIDKKCIQKAIGNETEYLYPILKNLNESIELSDTCINPDIITWFPINGNESISIDKIKEKNKPYIHFYSEPNIENSEDYKKVLNDNKCVACLVTSTVNKTINKKTYYIPYFLCRGPYIYNSSPFERKYINNERNKLAAYIAHYSPKHREDFFKILRSKDNTVEALGESLNTNNINLPALWWELTDVYKDYTFGFAMENRIEDGYITEKIMNVFLGGAIPLYWGSSKVKEIFNTKAFIYINDFSSFEDCANYIIELSKNKNIIKQIQNEPIFNYTNPLELWKYYDTPSPEWVKNIAKEINTRIEDFSEHE